MVRTLFAGIANRFPGAQMVFDVVPRWFSRMTLLGLRQTPHYRLPSMPWGINRDEIEPILRRWLPRLASVTLLHYRTSRGLARLAARMVHHMPFLRHGVPSLVHVALAPDAFSSNIVQFRKNPMTTLNGVIDAATDNATSGNDLAIAAGQIIARRVALGVAAAFDPTQADHAEFGRMMPEKLEAFSAAGVIMLEQSSQASLEITRFASDEIMTTAQATLAIAACSNPVAMAEAQGQFAIDWFNRAASNLFAVGLLALGVQKAAMVPIRRTLAANAERLGC
jgi:hypothetical protein